MCANHYITKDMKLTPNVGSKTSWVWLAMDAAEGEPQFEQLAIKFKLEKTALKYKEVFEDCQKKLPVNSDGNGVVEGVGKGNLELYTWLYSSESFITENTK